MGKKSERQKESSLELELMIELGIRRVVREEERDLYGGYAPCFGKKHHPGNEWPSLFQPNSEPRPIKQSPLR